MLRARNLPFVGVLPKEAIRHALPTYSNFKGICRKAEMPAEKTKKVQLGSLLAGGTGFGLRRWISNRPMLKTGSSGLTGGA